MPTIRDITYTETPHGPLLLDLYLPDRATPSPVPLVLFVHGGGWRNGSKETMRGQGFTDSGFAVASLNYRLTGTAPWPAQIHDCKAAVRWLRAHSREYGWHPDRIGAWGTSAGGHLVAMLAVTGNRAEWEGEHGPRKVSSALQAACNWCGPTDLLSLHDPARRVPRQDVIVEVTEALIGGKLEARMEAARHASPLLHIGPGCPPVFTMQGLEDDVVSPAHAQPFHDRMLAAGNDSELHLLAGAGHGFHTPEREQMVLDFFHRTLGTGRPAAATRGSRR